MLLGYDSIVSNIGIVGTGYVGLVSAVCFADLGHKVFGYDLNAQKITMLKKGESPIYEENLNELLIKGLQSTNLSFTNSINDLSDCEYVFLCVPTPQDQDG